MFIIGKESLAQWRNIVLSAFETELFGEWTEPSPEIDQEDLQNVSSSVDIGEDEQQCVANENGNEDSNNDADMDVDCEAGPSSTVDVEVNGDAKSDTANAEPDSSRAGAINKRNFQFNCDLICEHGNNGCNRVVLWRLFSRFEF